MELRSFLAGIFFLVGLELMLPMLGVKVSVTLPYAPVSGLAAAIICFVLAYYLFKGGN